MILPIQISVKFKSHILMNRQLQSPMNFEYSARNDERSYRYIMNNNYKRNTKIKAIS